MTLCSGARTPAILSSKRWILRDKGLGDEDAELWTVRPDRLKGGIFEAVTDCEVEKTKNNQARSQHCRK